MNTTILRRRVAALALAFAAAIAPAGFAVAEGEVDTDAREQEYQGLRAAIESADAAQRTLPTRTDQLAVPEIFSGSVRGCTQDGQVFHVRYNFSIDMDDLQSLLARTMEMDPERVQGVSGADRFMSALNDITRSLDHSMQSVVGPMIDSVFSGFIQGQEFASTLDRAVTEIGSNVGRSHDVHIRVLAEPPRQQTAAPCGVAAQPDPIPEPSSGMR